MDTKSNYIYNKQQYIRKGDKSSTKLIFTINNKLFNPLTEVVLWFYRFELNPLT